MLLSGFFIMPIFHTNASCVATRILILFFLFSAACSASAQTASIDQLLPPVVITAARIEQAQTDALPHTTVITAEKIRNSHAADLPSLLRREAGLQITQNGGPGVQASLFVRGAKPQQTLILIDGVPVRAQGFTGTAALEHILPDQIDHIEIVRGNVSAIYGSGAVGGVIQIFTRNGSGQPMFNLGAEAGSRETAKLTGGVAGKSGDTRYAVSLTRFKTNGFSANNTMQYPNENPDNDGYRNTSIAANVSHEWIKGHEFGARMYANDGKFSFDSGGFAVAPTEINNGRSKQQSLAAFSKNRLTQDWSSTVTLSQTATRTRNISIAASGFDVADNSDTTLLQWTNELRLAPDWTFTAGLDAGRERADVFSSDSFGAQQADYSRPTSSLFAGINGKADAHQLQANLRYDRVGGSGSEMTGYFGYGFVLTPAVKLIASASTAFNAPTLVQLFDPISGNSSLKAENSKSHELGAQYASGASLVRATFFKTQTRNQFAVDPNKCFQGAFPASCPTFNLAQGSNQGLELSAGGQVADIDASATLTLQNPKDDAIGEILIRRAKILGSLSLSKSYGTWSVGTDFQYAGSRPDIDFTSAAKKTLDSYWLANLNARYRMTKSVSLYGRVENVFNRNYQTTYGFNQPPRGLFAGLNWQQ